MARKQNLLCQDNTYLHLLLIVSLMSFVWNFKRYILKQRESTPQVQDTLFDRQKCFRQMCVSFKSYHYMFL
jgi:hypothetical protein